MTIHLYAQGFIYILGGADRHHYPKLELAGLSVFFTWVGAVAAAQPSLQMALLWLFVSHAVSGILHVQAREIERDMARYIEREIERDRAR